MSQYSEDYSDVSGSDSPQLSAGLSAFTDKKSVNQKESVAGSSGKSRDYGCPCGKFYLSACALYTHVKLKHNKVAPGQLIKPPPQAHSNKGPRQMRGRYLKNNTTFDLIRQDSDYLFDANQQIQKKLQLISSFQYEQEYLTSNGDQTCQDMGTKFLYDVRYLSDVQKKVLSCFLNCLKQYLNNNFKCQYWEQKQPDEIILLANDFIKFQSKQQIKNRYPLEKQVLMDLILILCKWMYHKKWTNNKLIKRQTPSVHFINNQQ